MSSTTGLVINSTGVPITFTAQQNPPHGNTPKILVSSLKPGTQANVFLATSSGAGVEGWVQASGAGKTWQMNYDNPVVGGNSGTVNPGNGKCDVGSGDDNTNTYTLNPIAT